VAALETLYLDVANVQRFRSGLVFKGRPSCRWRLSKRSTWTWQSGSGSASRPSNLPSAAAPRQEIMFFFDNPLVRIHFIIEMIWRNGLAPFELAERRRSQATIPLNPTPGLEAHHRYTPQNVARVRLDTVPVTCTYK